MAQLALIISVVALIIVLLMFLALIRLIELLQKHMKLQKEMKKLLMERSNLLSERIDSFHKINNIRLELARFELKQLINKLIRL